MTRRPDCTVLRFTSAACPCPGDLVIGLDGVENENENVLTASQACISCILDTDMGANGRKVNTGSLSNYLADSLTTFSNSNSISDQASKMEIPSCPPTCPKNIRQHQHQRQHWASFKPHLLGSAQVSLETSSNRIQYRYDKLPRIIWTALSEVHRVNLRE